MIKIQYIPNRFVEECHEFSTKTLHLLSAVEEFIEAHPHFAKPLSGKKVVVYINGTILNRDVLTTHICNDGDVVEVTHTISGGNWFGALFFIFGPMAHVGILDYELWSMFLDLFEWDLDVDVDGSKTYSWDGPKTGTGAEKPVPLIYGEHLVGGQYINFNIWSDGQENWADFLLGLGEGEVAGIVDEEQTGLVASIPTKLEDVNTRTPYIKLNNQFVSDYTDCLWAGRSGTNNQTPIPGFRSQKSTVNYPHEVAALPDWTSPEHTTNTKIDGYSIKLTSPSLFVIYDSGNIKSQTVQYRTRHKVNPGGVDWVYSPGADIWYAITAKSRSEVKAYQTITTASRDTYDIQVQRKNPVNNEITSKKTVENKLSTTHIIEIVDEELAFPNTAVEAIRLKATDQLSGTFPNVQTLVRGLKVRVPDLTNGGAGDLEFEDYYWNGTGLEFEEMPGGGGTKTWNGTSYIIQWTSNPAYIIRDLMLNVRYGFGEVVSTTTIDEDTINIAARRCWQNVESSHKNELHIVIDTENDPTTILAQLALVSRIRIFWSGGYIKFKYEEDEDPIQLFTMGNIVKDSFKVDYVDHTKTPNRIEVTFADKDDGWKKNTIEVVDETEWALGKPKRTKTLNLIGVTDRAQALREAKFLLNKGRYVRKSIEFVTTIAACHSEPGDVIAFQHDVPQWGWGGRVISGDSTNCVIDQDMPQNIIDAPTTYQIKIIHNDDTIETYDIVSVSGKTVTIGGGDTFSPVPTEDESYILGKEGSTIAEYRIRQISLTGEEEVQIAATEHNANIYSDTGLVISDSESTELPNPAEFAPQVSNLTLFELPDASGMGISFRQPEDTLVWNHADIYFSNDDIHYIKIGEGYGDDTIEYYDVTLGERHYIRVYSINHIGIKNPNPAEAFITIGGKDQRDPGTPTGLEIFGQGNNTIFGGRDCKFRWKASIRYDGAGSLPPESPAGQIPGESFLAQFVIEIWNWGGTALLRTETTTELLYTYTWEKNAEDNAGSPQRAFQIRVYQKSIYGAVSTIPAMLTVNNIAPDMSAWTPGLVTGFSNVGVNFIDYHPIDTDLSHWRIYYGTSTPLNASYLTITRAIKTHSIHQLPQDVVYNVQVEPYDLFGVGTRSQVASITVSALPAGSVTGEQVTDDFVELELYKINFQYISWGQFAIYDDFNDSDRRATPDPSTYDARVYGSKLDNDKDYTPAREFGFVSKTYDEITVVATGNSATTGAGYLVDENRSWWTNQNKNLSVVDDLDATFNIASNTASRLTLTSGTPSTGVYKLQDSDPSYAIAFCTFADSTQGDEYGYVKLEGSFDNGGNYQTFLNTETGVNLLGGTVLVADTGEDYIVKITLKNDGSGQGPEVYGFLVGTDPSPWRF